MRRMILVLLMCLFLSMVSVPVYAAIIYVDVDATGNNDGSDWGNAYTDLQNALADAKGNGDATDEIWVADGTYYPGVTRTDAFSMASGIALYGGFSGVESTRTDRNSETNVTILSGDIGTPDDTSDNCYHVFYHNAVLIDETAILDGFTVTGGNANGNSPHFNGGGMYNAGASITITNCTFKGNQAEQEGGGLYSISSSTVFTNCYFIENQAGHWGGGMYSFKSTETFTDCSFRSNLSDGRGGGIYNDESSAIFSNCLFSQNQSLSMAGGVENYDSAATFTDCTFTENKAVDVGGVWNNGNSDYNGPPTTFTNCSFIRNQADAFGGGMANSIESVLITNCSFTENQAQDAGGIYNYSTSPMIISCTFSGNSVTNDGAGIYNYGASKIISSLFIENIAGGDGGGIYTFHSNPTTNNEVPTITNCTFSSNQANGNGGGICSVSEALPSNYPADFPIPSPEIMNCIFWGDTAAVAGNEIFTEISTPSLSYNLIQGSGGSGIGWPVALGVDGGNNIDTDPMFSDTVNYRLSPESPCIDSGNFFTFAVGVDIDLEPRFFDGKGDGAVLVDIGADEFYGTDPSNAGTGSSNSDNDDDSDNGCFISILR